MELHLDPTSFSGSVPLFPLPGTVLLPGGLLPLHVFEERYREMLRDALAGERLIGMAFLLPGYEQASDPENPPIEPTVCVGRIVVEQELPDGRFNMVLAGLRRARVVAEDRSRPYRLAEVELIDDDRPGDFDEALAGQRLYEFLTQLPARLVRQRERLVQATELLRDRVGEDVPLGAVLDLLADSLELLPEDRLSLLRERHVGRRLGVLTQGLAGLARQIQGQAPRVSWRPRFSDN